MGKTIIMKNKISPFNSFLETGIRSLTLLVAAYPDSLDLQRLVEYDYLSVHSGDAGGPVSLHAPLPLRTGEILVRRSIIESGLALMMSRNLAVQIPTNEGIRYFATDASGAFLSALSTLYITKLKERANWVVEQFGNYNDEQLSEVTRQLFDKWTTQFQPIEGIKGNAQ
jgi:hypothetical protein